MTRSGPTSNRPRPVPDAAQDPKAETSQQPTTDAPKDTAETPAEAQGADTPAAPLSMAERKAIKIREREEAIARVEAARAAKMAAMVENVEKLDEDDPVPAAETATTPVAPPAEPERVRGRHVMVITSFLIFVVGITALAAWYLWERAADRYVSTAGFSVRTEEVGSAIELLGGVAELSGSSSSDTDILYKFIQSQELVRTIDNALDLRTLWSKGDPDRDPIFSYHPPGSIEELTDYWAGMVKVYNDSGTGLIDLEVQAFTAQDAQDIAQMIYDESSLMINRLSAIAREDATRYAREELEGAVERLTEARQALTRFRNENQIVSPDSTLQIQTGLLSSLEQQLAQALIDADILRQTSSANDPRLQQAERRRDVIEDRIQEERNKLGLGADGQTDGNTAFVDLVGEFERLSVDREFAEQSYTAALAAFDAAVAESRRQSRYIAAHVQPTLAETAVRPDRPATLGLVALFSFLVWSVVVLIGYSLRDRR
ncbi:capsule biosynthesis protein [uncultured Tateyamaria sp.]|uniref:capsule biosynthesis protein n=1 Tax=Rhodobacterales TaxID=204455 RepID=UPI0026078BE7|nr:capsule biosynthesis protein [uncultured Tateyamaria sp.]